MEEMGIARLTSIVAVSSAAFGIGCAAASTVEKDRSDEIVVRCTSTVGWDPGGCRRPARKKCDRDAEFIAVLASTPLPGGLHVVTARYRCRK